MYFKNLKTGVTWEVTNKDRIKELLFSKDYEQVIKEEKPIKKVAKKKEE